jgi:hypothetical protein
MYPKESYKVAKTLDVSGKAPLGFFDVYACHITERDSGKQLAN